MNKKTTYLTHAAMIATLYIILTYVANMFGMASGAIQIRLSEALCILPFYTASAVPGLFVGCVLSNLLTGCAIADVIFGSLATLIGAIMTRKLRFNKYLAPIGPILTNTLIVPLMLRYIYGIKPLWLSFITVGVGEIISAGILGMILLLSFQKYQRKIFSNEKQ